MKKRVFDTGRHLPKAGMSDYFELVGNRKQFVEKPILNQSKRDKTVLYGRYAVNKLLGRGYTRDTYDFDVYSRQPKRHAVQIEKSIDRGTNSNLAYVEAAPIDMYGKKKIVYRVKTRPHDVGEADFNSMPSDIRFKLRNGVRYESVDRAHAKYDKMIKTSQTHRMPKAFWDRDDIRTYRLIKKNRW